MSQGLLLCLIHQPFCSSFFICKICQNAFDTSHVKRIKYSCNLIFACSAGLVGGRCGAEDGFLSAKSQSPSLRFVVKDSPVCHLASIDLACFVPSQWHVDAWPPDVKSYFLSFTSNDRVSTKSMTSEYD